jgi:predicted permease
MRRAFRLPTRRAHLRTEVEEEIAFHLEMRARRLVAGGMLPEDARAEALRQFGNVESVRQSCVTLDHQRERAMRRTNFLDELRRDVLYAFRTMRHNPVFTAVVVVTLALGIGANTAIFTLVDAILLRPLPVSEPDELVAIGDPTRVGSMSMGSPRADLFSYPLYRDVRERQRAFTGVLASGRIRRLDVRVSGSPSDDAEHPRGRYVSGNYFDVLGVPAAVGRTFGSEEDRAPGASPVVVISHGYWTRRFAADRAAIGRTVTIDGVPMTIIGVAQRGFAGEIVGSSIDVWVPLTMQPVLMSTRPWLEDRSVSWLLLMGRLAPGVSIDQARASITTITKQVLGEYERTSPELASGPGLEVPVSSGAKGFSGIRSEFRVPLLTLMAGVGLLLLIVCANVANLLLARAAARTREMSVRIALGAARRRLVRQLLTESLLLALLGAAGGLTIAWWGSRLLLALAGDGGSTIPLDLRLDLPVLAFTAAISVLAVVLSGLVPALRASRVDLAASMRAHARAVGSSGTGGRSSLSGGKMLVASQVALSLLLLTGAGLLVRSLRLLQETELGVARDRLLITTLDVRSRGYDDARLAALTRELTARLERLPGVAAVTYSENGIFSGVESNVTVAVPGFQASSSEDSVANSDNVGPGYIRAIGARLLQGRDLTPRDIEGAPPVALVNETFARHYFPNASPLGKWALFDSVRAEIVGVVADVRHQGLRDAPVRRVYFPYFNTPIGPIVLHFEVRATDDPARLSAAVRREIAAVDPALPILAIDPLTQLIRQSLREARLVTRLTATFGVLALLLAAVGLYGVMSYAIARRTGEIGLRVALGAQPRDVVRMVLLEALSVVAVGVAIGLPLGLAALRLLRSQLYGVGVADPVAMAVALAVLTLTALAAVLVPASRAARVAPLVALRQE